MATIPGKLFLAPMAETSTPALRRSVKEFCPETVLYSEMLSAGAIAARAPHNEPLVHRYDFDDPLIYQIVGANPRVMADACSILSERGCCGIDVNMGCPNHDIVKKGQGAWLLTDFEKAREIVRSCRTATPGLLSIKMRTGYEENEERYFIDFIRMLEDEGTDYIAVHPRPARLGFRRTADWRLVALAKKRITIPVIGNGDIDSPGTAVERMLDSGCEGIMIGRAAVQSPWIFRLTADLMNGRDGKLEVDVRDVFIRTLGYMSVYLPERLHKSRGHRFAAYFAKNARYGHDLFSRIRSENTITAMQHLVEEYYRRNPEEAIKKYIVGNGRVLEEKMPFTSLAGGLEPAGAVLWPRIWSVKEQIMEYMRVWTEVDIKDIEDHIVFVDDKYGHCPGCKKIGIELKELVKCPSCGREFKYVTSKEAQGGKFDIVMRTKKKLPNLTFVDYNDYDHELGKKKAGSLFKI